MAAQQKVSLYNQADLKNTTDDVIPTYLNSLKFKQSHFFVDVRLAIGYGAFALAAACFAWDYYVGWDKTKYYTFVAVACYTVLQGALAKWISTVEKGNVYLGTTPDGKYEINIATSTKKNDPTYNVVAIVTDIAASEANAATAPDPEIFLFSSSFTSWFDESGYFVARPFQEFLASNVPAIGKFDPKRAKTETEKLWAENPGLLDAALSADTTAATAASGAEPTEKKPAKRRKA